MIHLLFNDKSSEPACQPLSLAVMNTKGGLWEDAVQLYLQAWHSISPGLWLHAALHHSPPAVPLSWSSPWGQAGFTCSPAVQASLSVYRYAYGITS